jgi:hypothetical protein
VKCDERPGGCLNCQRLSLTCPSGPDPSQSSGPAGDTAQTQAGLKRLRTYRSCKACRGSKTRCSGQRPTCQRCRYKKLECVYDGKQTPAWVDNVLEDGVQPQPSPPAGDGTLQELTPASTPAERPPSTVNAPDVPEADAHGSQTSRADQESRFGPFPWYLSQPEKRKNQLIQV